MGALASPSCGPGSSYTQLSVPLQFHHVLTKSVLMTVSTDSVLVTGSLLSTFWFSISCGQLGPGPHEGDATVHIALMWALMELRAINCSIAIALCHDQVVDFLLFLGVDFLGNISATLHQFCLVFYFDTKWSDGQYEHMLPSRRCSGDLFLVCNAQFFQGGRQTFQPGDSCNAI